MVILTKFTLPSTKRDLFPEYPVDDTPFFLAFLASTDPATNKPWCPDVEAALPRLNETFVDSGARCCGYVHVGQKDAWKDLSNVFRTEWGVKCVPTLVRYEVVDGEVRDVGRLEEGEILDAEKLRGFVFEEAKV
ncbi:uncharacterized protein BDV14DRAFT_106382 [Aspergillus stella-maris]|uniref:uncharacterized protein n=1 Tax=Aspergillus stella-maris TaxID=1810926 RepID=UPI003CCE113C